MNALALRLAWLPTWLALALNLAAQSNAPTLATLTELSSRSKQFSFKEVIFATTGHRVLDFDTNNPAHFALHKKISAAAVAAAKRAKGEGLFAARANEAGN